MAFRKKKIHEEEIEYERRSFAFLVKKEEGEENTLRSKDAKKPAFERAPNAAPECSEHAPKRSEHAPDVALERSILQNEHSWSIKAAKNGDMKRHTALKAIIFLILFTGCIYITMNEGPVKVQACAYLVTFAAFMVLDPFETWDRFLAPQTRILSAMFVLMIMINILNPGKTILISTLMCGLLMGFVSKCLNKKWLASHNWLMSAEAQKSLRIDPENTASITWRAHGRRETRTILYELGFDVYDDILDAMHKPVYYCGYLHGLKKEKELQKQAEKLTLEVEKCNMDYEDLLEGLTIIQSDLQKAEAEAIQNEAEAGKWKTLFEKQKEYSKKLEAANEELLAGVNEPEEFVEQKTKIVKLSQSERDMKIMECLEHGMTYREIQQALGVGANVISNVSKMRNAKKQEAS